MARRAFTLIELLIVVAIIAILAAIAVPNFLEAQIRAKVSRAMSDQRTLALAISCYMVDNNGTPWIEYHDVANALKRDPEKMFSHFLYSKFISPGTYTPGPSAGCCWVLTSPVSYISTVNAMLDPFGSELGSKQTSGTNAYNRKLLGYGLISLKSGFKYIAPGTSYYYDGGGKEYKTVYDSYNDGQIYNWKWEKIPVSYVLISAGPDGFYDHREQDPAQSPPSSGAANFTNIFTNASSTYYTFFKNNSASGLSYCNGFIPYDPTNGSKSYGDIVRFGN